MKLIRLENTTDTFFAEAWELYQNAFPLEERRFIDSQTVLMQNPKYHCEVVVKEEQFIGFILWWEFDSLRYVEHFAIVEAQRKKGFGKLILEEFMKGDKKPVILEVELPSSEMNQRRITFYEKMGFKLNAHYYEIPPIHDGFSHVELLIMSFPSLISEEDVKHFIERCHPIIFKK